MIAPDSAHLTRPAVADAKHSFDIIAFYFLTRCRVQHHRLDAEEGFHRRAGFGGVCTGQRGHQVAAGFSLPPGVNDGALPATDNFVVPVPGLGIYRFTHGAQHLEGAEIAFSDKIIALTH